MSKTATDHATEIGDAYALAPMQRSMLYQSLSAPGAGAYVQQAIGELRERVDVALLQRAWELVIDRHPVLRTSFRVQGDDPVQEVHRRVDVRWTVQDWTALAAREQQERFDFALGSDRQRDFELSRAPLLRLALFRFGESHSRLLWTYHHALLDGRAVRVVLREVFDLYDALAAGNDPPSISPPHAYREHVGWLATRDPGLAGDFWRRELAGVSAPTSLAGLLPKPKDVQAPATYGAHEIRLSRQSTETLASLARAHGFTLNTLVLGAWAQLLGRYSAETDVTFATTLSLRGAGPEAFRDMVGLLINTVPMRVSIPPGATLGRWLETLRAHWNALRAHAWMPLPDILRAGGIARETARHLSLVVFEHAPLEAALAEDRRGWHTRTFTRRSWAGNPLTLVAFGAPELSLKIVYERSLFEPASVVAMLGHLRCLLEGVPASLERTLSEQPFLDAAEERRLLVDWNDTARRFEREACAHVLFEQQADRTPDATALEWGERQFTYRELELRANRLAHALRRSGIASGTLVGICTGATAELVVAMLGVLKAGGAYLPLDPDLPPERIDGIVCDAGPAMIVGSGNATRSLAAYAGNLLVLDQADDPIARESDARLDVDIGLEDVAYAVYTSGSTGEPKGIVVSQRSLANHTLALVERYGISAADRRLQFVSVGSDVLIAEVFPVLAAGGTLVLRPDAGPLSTADFLRLLDERRITIVGLPSAYWHEWVTSASAAEAPFPSSLRIVVSGMDSVRADLFARWRQLARGRVRWFNAYGPSEATCTATSYEADLASDEPVEVVPIGRPLSNVRVYILDAQGRLVPVGVPGEIHIGGDGVARGYLNRPELTAQRFVPDRFGDRPGSRMYRTGDIGRFLPDGNIEFLGRVDDQLKIRGFRVEPREIEAALCRLPEVRDACVVARGESVDQRRLVAYVVGTADSAVSPPELRARLRRVLPGYMLPAAIVGVAALPLTPSGKVDQRALPDPDFDAAESRSGNVSARNALESALVAIWESVLSARVGVLDDFFDVGGDSLGGMRVLNAVAREFGVHLPFDALYGDEATVAGMAARIEAERGRDASGAGLRTIARRPAGVPIPLSSAQAGAWFLHRLDPGGAAYNEARLWGIDGELDVDALRAALAAVATRQPMLRTRFVVVDAEPQQVIDPEPSVDLEFIDLPGDEADEAARLERAALAARRRRFDLARATPLRWTVFRLRPGRYALLRVWHHILGDATSSRILHRELSQAYAIARLGHAPALPALPVDYADFAVWQAQAHAGDKGEAQLAFWKERLAGLPTLSLHTDFVRPPAQSFRGATVRAKLPRGAASRLEAIARGRGATRFVTFLAAFSALLSRLSGDVDLAIGTPVAGRVVPELEGIIGFFANSAVIRIDLSGSPTVETLLTRARDAVRDVVAHQEAPFERVVDALGVPRDPSRNPLFQVAFALWERDGDELDLVGARCRRLEGGTDVAKFDLSLTLVAGPDGFDMRWGYCTDLYARETVERMSGQFALLVDAMGKDPARTVASLPLMDDATAARIRRMAFGAATAYPAHHTIAQRFAEQVAATPSARAVDALDYVELDRAANRLARELRARGVGAGAVVAVARRASADVAVSWLAVLKAGGAYLPIDADLPQARISHMLTDARAAHAIVDDALAGVVARPGVEMVCPERDAQRIATHSSDALPLATQAEDPAYVMYTSGSTGLPKGVVVPHRAVLRLVCATDCAQLGPGDKVAQLANPAFDASTFEFWGALLNGASVVSIAKATAIVPRKLAAAIAAERVTVLFLTTALFNLVAREVPDAFRHCRCVLFGGEAVEPRWVEAVLRAGAPGHLLHVYGPTEATTFATWHEVRDVAADAACVPIGRPLANTEAFVLRDDGELAAIGEPGELWLGGPALACGYLNAAPDDASRFIERAIAQLPARRLYRTGDRARLGEDGAIEFLGRHDRQVKLRGHRIELAEIEAAISRLPKVQAAAVALRGETTDTRQIVAYLVAADPAGPPPSDAWQEMRRLLPDYMLPASIVWVKSLPLTASGKIDRAALPVAAPLRPSAPGIRVAPRDMLEHTLARIWERVLGVREVGVLDHFFAVGGHSLLAARLCDEIERQTGIAAPVSSLFADDTIAGLARVLREHPDASATPILVLDDDPTRTPFVFLHGDLSGGGFYSRSLSCALGPGQPMFVVQPHGLDNAAIPDTIEAMAAERIGALREVRAHGPYILGGYCNGALVAFEMARQLDALGEAVPGVIVIEASAPADPATDRAGEGRYVAFDGRGGWRALEARDRPSESQLRYSMAMGRYAGGPFAGTLVLVRTRGNESTRRDLGWGRFARRVEVHVLPGDHTTVVTRNVDALAQVIRGAIARVLGQPVPDPLPTGAAEAI